MKILIALMLLIIGSLQYRLWYGDGSVEQNKLYQQRLDALELQLDEKKRRNQALYAEVLELREGDDAIEERARYELGLIKENETFFQVIE